MTKELTTYQIYLILLGYLSERDEDTEMPKTMLTELYRRTVANEVKDGLESESYKERRVI